MNYTGYKTVYDYLSSLDIQDGIHSMELENGEIIDFEIYNYLEDMTFDKTPVLGDNIPDTKMLILKFHKNLIIEAGVVITPQVRKKGMVIYCDGVIKNNGIISMTARGANAEGQDVLLYRNKCNLYETVPKDGAKGGAEYTFYKNGWRDGNAGLNGEGRQTGGGGSGGVVGASYSSGTAKVARGGNGTSYSGGSGSGGITMMYEPSTTWNGEIPSDTGGKGGDAIGTADTREFMGGGIGNPNGTSIRFNPNVEGTGGLLIIYANYFVNNGTIEACGVGNYKSTHLSSQSCGATGGSSGGGSINIFYISRYKNNGTINVDGGVNRDVYTYLGNGANGGKGTSNTNEIFDKYYLIKNNNTYKYYLDNAWHDLLEEPTFNDFLQYGIRGLSSIASDLWLQLSGEVEILAMSDSNKPLHILYTALPNPQILMMKLDIDLSFTKLIKSIIAEDILSENSIIKRLVSTDKGKTWLYFDNGWKEFEFIYAPPIEDYPNTNWDEWINSEHSQDIENILKLGLSQEQLSQSGITQKQWNDLFFDNTQREVRFITVLKSEDYNNTDEIRNLKVIQENYGEYVSNRNFKQVQKLNQIVVTPEFDSEQIKINYML